MSKVWFVTGANSGIGAGVVNAALKAGHRVVATGRSMAKLRDAFPHADDRSLALVELDVTDEGQAYAAVAKAVELFGTVDVLVSNAGFCVLGNFEDLAAADVERQMATNFYGAVHVMHAVLPVMRRQRSGHIFTISSVAGGVGMSQCSAYSASKFALEGLSMAVAAEVEQFGIDVTIVEPGFFRTSFLNQNNYEAIDTRIEDYATEGSAREGYAAYDGNQPGDPVKLGEALLTINAMDKPVTLFVAGSDAIEMLKPPAEERLNAISAQAEGCRITTIEGLQAPDGTFHVVQTAFMEHDAFQCGYCTPGQIMSAVACIREGHAGSDDEIREYMSGNLCRCGAYPHIVAAIRDAAGRLSKGAAL